MAQKFKNGGFLPYYKAKYSREDVELSVYLRRKFIPLVRRQFPQHGLVECRPASRLAYLRKHSKTHRFYLRFDLKLFYPSVNQAEVADVLLENYRCLSGKNPPDRMRKRVNFGFSSYFSKQPHGFGLPMGSKLSAIAAPALLLGLCNTIAEYPFLCYQDDFLVLLPSKADIEVCFLRVNAELKNLGLSINVSKLSSGRFANTAVSFLGFRYAGGSFGVDTEKQEAFKQRIKSLSALTRKYKNQAAFIKQLNRAINGFGHYYKHASVRLLFGTLDAFIRQRVRRYLARIRSTTDKKANLSWTSARLYNDLRLRSLIEIVDGLKPTPIRQKITILTNRSATAFSMSRTEELLVHQNKLLKDLLNAQRESQLLLAAW